MTEFTDQLNEFVSFKFLTTNAEKKDNYVLLVN